MPEKHYFEQKEYTEKYLLPYLQRHIPDFHKKSVLEIGCAEGGLLEIFQNLGMETLGIEISKPRVDLALTKNSSLNIIEGDITDSDITNKVNKKFDVIIMREVIEHIHNKESAFDNIKNFLNDGGFLFVTFPPKWSPFAGHQQIAKSFLKVVPYLHLLPKSLLQFIASSAGENHGYVEEIKLHFSTGCSIKKFEKLSSINLFKVIKKELYLFRPIYTQRYGLPKIKWPNIPVFREVATFGCESLLQKRIF